MLTVAPRKTESLRLQRKLRRNMREEVDRESGSKETVPRSFHQIPCHFGGLMPSHQSKPATTWHQTSAPVVAAIVIAYEMSAIPIVGIGGCIRTTLQWQQIRLQPNLGLAVAKHMSNQGSASIPKGRQRSAGDCNQEPSDRLDYAFGSGTW